MDKEQFKDIEFKGKLITVGNYGTILTYDKKKARKLQLNSSGYLCYTKDKCYLAHRLVAFAWVENTDPTQKKIVNHIDGNKINNHYKNLEWVTHSENMMHSINVLGRKITQTGLINNWINPVHCKPVSIYDLNGKLVKKCKSGVEAAKFLNAYPTSINNVLKGRTKTTKGHIVKYTDTETDKKCVLN
jgi:hypothetical protein